MYSESQEHIYGQFQVELGNMQFYYNFLYFSDIRHESKQLDSPSALSTSVHVTFARICWSIQDGEAGPNAREHDFNTKYPDKMLNISGYGELSSKCLMLKHINTIS